jgi:hypothetical protein
MYHPDGHECLPKAVDAIVIDSSAQMKSSRRFTARAPGCAPPERVTPTCWRRRDRGRITSVGTDGDAIPATERAYLWSTIKALDACRLEL